MPALSRKQIILLARKLRQEMTPAERQLWQLLRNKQLKGYKFYRQHPFYDMTIQGKIYFFIADFYCTSKKSVIELDGKVHEEQKEYDNYRDDLLLDRNIKTLRIKNEEMQNEQEVLREILQFLEND